MKTKQQIKEEIEWLEKQRWCIIEMQDLKSANVRELLDAHYTLSKRIEKLQDTLRECP